MASALLKIYVAGIALASVLGLLYVYISPPSSMQSDRDGVAHFTPPVMHAETGEPVSLGELMRHYRGD